MNVMSPKPSTTAELTLRQDLAAAFRLVARLDWHESVGNHFSAVLDDSGDRFLINPKWQHFSFLKASDLVALSASASGAAGVPDTVDSTAWCIHGAIHRLNPKAKVVLHCHPPYATALCCLKDPTIKAIDQNTARFYNRHAVDLEFGGMADEANEGERIARALGDHQAMMMGNHGVTVVGETVADAFEALYFLERAAKTLVLAYSSGQPLNELPPDIAEKTARSWDDFRGQGIAHFEAQKQMLDREHASYRN